MEPTDPSNSAGEPESGAAPSGPPTPPPSSAAGTPPTPPPPTGGRYGAGQYQPGGAPPPPPLPPPPPPYGQQSYGPPPGAFPAGAPALSRPFVATDAVVYGWNAFRNNVGPLVLISLVIVAVSAISSRLQSLGDNFLTSIGLSLVGSLVSMILTMGLIRAALMILDGRTPAVSDVFRTDDLGVYIVAAILSWLVTAVGIVLCILPGLVAAFLLSLFGYAIIDHYESGARGVQPTSVGSLRTSLDIVSRNVGSFIVLLLLLFVVNLLGVALCGIGMLVSIPVSAVATAYAWRSFTGGTIAPQAG